MTDWTDARRMQALAVAANILEGRAAGADPAHPIVEDVAILRDMRERLAKKESAYQCLAQQLEVPVEMFGAQTMDELRQEFAKPIVSIDAGDPEAEPMPFAAGGWRAPSANVASFLDEAPHGTLPPEVPAVRSPRGGMKFGEVHAPKREPEPQEPSPDGSAGHWEYGVDISEPEDDGPEIVASRSGWHWEPYRSAVEALSDHEGRVVKRWVRDPGPWLDA